MNPLDMAADLAARFRLDKRRRSWGGDCPACSYPRAFSIRVGEGARPLLYCANGCTRDVLQEVARSALGNAWTPGPAPDPADVQAARERKQAAALRLFAGSTPTITSDPAGRYLTRRGLAHLIGCPALRYRGDCPHPEGGRLPALVAEVLDAAGQPVAAHRTYLTPDGAKAGADLVKAASARCGVLPSGSRPMRPRRRRWWWGRASRRRRAPGCCWACPRGRPFPPATWPPAWACRRRCAPSRSRPTPTRTAARLPMTPPHAGERMGAPSASPPRMRPGRTSTTC